MINKYLNAFNKTKKNREGYVMFFRIDNVYEAYYEDALTVENLAGYPSTNRLVGKDSLNVCVIPRSEFDQCLIDLTNKGASVLVYEARINGVFNIEYDGYAN